jgi:regulator of RNase E activity RraA
MALPPAPFTVACVGPNTVMKTIPFALQSIRQFDTCAIANAIEHFRVRMRNEGFTKPGLRCITEPDCKLLGYAVTMKIRFSNPAVTGIPYVERTDWWSAVERYREPRIAVIQDADAEPGAGAAVGEVHAAILKALRFEGLITNAGVRDIPAISKLGFPIVAPFIAVSHSYMHVVEYGEPVEILGLPVQTGDLLFADCHGAISIPIEILEELPKVVARMQARDRRIVDVCLSPDFSTEKLLNAIGSDPE